MFGKFCIDIGVQKMLDFFLKIPKFYKDFNDSLYNAMWCVKNSWRQVRVYNIVAWHHHPWPVHDIIADHHHMTSSPCANGIILPLRKKWHFRLRAQFFSGHPGCAGGSAWSKQADRDPLKLFRLRVDMVILCDNFRHLTNFQVTSPQLNRPSRALRARSGLNYRVMRLFSKMPLRGD